MVEYTDYVLDSHIECERQERQALLQGPDCILKHFSSGHWLRILDGGSGCGAAARLLAKTFPQAEVVGVEFT